MSATLEFPLVRTSIAGVPVAELAAKYGTPTYVYDFETIERAVKDLAPFDVIRFAQKANSNIAVLEFLRQRGVLVDAVSAGEVHRAQLAGYELHGEPHPVVYTADIFDRASLDLVVEKGLHVNCGSEEMIRQLGERAPGSNVTLRINPGFGHGHSQKTNTGGEQSKHGIWHENLDGALQLADRYGVTVTGLHMHIGSGADFEHLSQVGQALEAVARKIGRSITTISAGGGLPTRYRSHDTQVDVERYFKIWDETRRRLQEEFGHAITLEIEPGRYLVAECGFLVAEIRAIKRMGNNLFYLLDAGFNSLARPILYGAYHPMSICPAKGGAGDRETVPVVVGGPLCESGDIFTQQDGGFVCSRDLPVAEVGDFLVIEAAGAYGFVMASNYNSKPLPAEVAIYRGSHQVVRARQTNEDLTRGERLPSWNG